MLFKVIFFCLSVLTYSIEAKEILEKLLGEDGAQLQQTIDNLQLELDIRKRCLQGEWQECHQLKISGEYHNITSVEIMDAGVERKNLGNLPTMISDVTIILDKLDSTSARDRKLISNFLKKQESGCSLENDTKKMPTEYRFYLQHKLKLTPEQIVIFKGETTVHYIVLQSFIDPIIVKVTYHGDSVEVKYYKKIVPSSSPSYEQPTTLLAQKLTINRNMLFNYDITAGAASLDLKDDGGNLLVLGSSIRELKLDATVALDKDNHLGTNSSYDYEEKKLKHRVYFEHKKQKVLSLEYVDKIKKDKVAQNIMQESNGNITVSSELYQYNRNGVDALIKAKFKCNKMLSEDCKTWVSFAVKF
jgi:hypothetical protein